MDESIVRRQLVALLRGKGAHVALAGALDALPAELRGRRPDGLVHSVWEIVEHMRLAQEDILRYVLDPEWRSPAWPAGYWPASPEPDEAAWEATLKGFGEDLEAVVALVEDGSRDLTEPLPHAQRHTLLREVLLVADHNAYHVAQIVDTRRALGAWPTR